MRSRGCCPGPSATKPPRRTNPSAGLRRLSPKQIVELRERVTSHESPITCFWIFPITPVLRNSVDGKFRKCLSEEITRKWPNGEARLRLKKPDETGLTCCLLPESDPSSGEFAFPPAMSSE